MGGPADPLVALERAIRPALLRTPCLVSFSGGLDSSLILAVAVRVARREGLPDPVPVSWRFTDAPRADESASQDAIINELRLQDRVRMTAYDELDLIGPIAMATLTDGPVNPPNRHLLQPMLDLAPGGSLLTGFGGDQILSGWLRPPHRTRWRRLKNRVPADLRARIARHRTAPLAWLHAPVARRVWAARLRDVAAEPVALDPRVRWHAHRRGLISAVAALRHLARRSGVELGLPLVDPAFVDSLARFGGGRPAPSRPELIAAFAGAAIPAVVGGARPKARFGDVFFRGPTRDFVSQWDGTGVDPTLVDVDRLRALWSTWPIPPLTAGLVQQAFLSHRVAA